MKNKNANSATIETSADDGSLEQPSTSPTKQGNTTPVRLTADKTNAYWRQWALEQWLQQGRAAREAREAAEQEKRERLTREAQEAQEAREKARKGPDELRLWQAEEELELLFEEGDCGDISARRVSVIEALRQMPKAQAKLLVLVAQGFTKVEASRRVGLDPTNKSRNYHHALQQFVRSYNGLK